MTRALVTYATFAGSTAELAQAVGEELSKSGFEVEIRPLSEVDELALYDAIVVGDPMILGWQRAARRFLHKQRRILRPCPFAIFVTPISLTQGMPPAA